MKAVTFSLSTGDCAGLQWGNPASPLILALHGWLDNAASFLPLADHLSKTHCLLAVDFPGHGLSDHLCPGAHYNFIDAVRFLDELWQELPQTPACLLGHSMGGAVASLLASARQKEIKKLVLLDALGPLGEAEERTAVRLREALHNNRKREGKPRVFEDRSTPLRARAAVGDVDARFLKPVVERNLKPVEGGWQWRSDPRLRMDSLTRLTEAQIQNLLSEITASTLLITASWGLLNQREQYVERLKYLRDLTHIELEGSHHFHMEHPDRVAKLVLNFLTQENRPVNA